VRIRGGLARSLAIALSASDKAWCPGRGGLRRVIGVSVGVVMLHCNILGLPCLAQLGWQDIGRDRERAMQPYDREAKSRRVLLSSRAF